MQASWLSQVSKHGGLAGGFNDVVRGHMRTSLLANSLQAPRVVPNTASQMSSFGEEAQRSAQPSPKHAGAGVDSHLSLRVPAMQQNQPVAGHGVGFGHLLPGLNGVAKANDSSERGMAITGQQPPQMQGRNMQSSSRFSSLGNLAPLSLHIMAVQKSVIKFSSYRCSVYISDLPDQRYGHSLESFLLFHAADWPTQVEWGCSSALHNSLSFMQAWLTYMMTFLLRRWEWAFFFCFENIPLCNHIAGFRSSNMSNIGPISEYFSFTFAGTGYYDVGQ